MKKKIIKDSIFYACKTAGTFTSPYTYGEVKNLLSVKSIVLQDSDILTVGWEEGWNEGDSVRDDMYFIRVERNREQTDAEFEKDKAFWEQKAVESKKERHENYLKLKKEFEA